MFIGNIDDPTMRDIVKCGKHASILGIKEKSKKRKPFYFSYGMLEEVLKK